MPPRGPPGLRCGDKASIVKFTRTHACTSLAEGQGRPSLGRILGLLGEQTGLCRCRVEGCQGTGAFLSGEQASGEGNAHSGAASWGSPGQSEASGLLEK